MFRAAQLDKPMRFIILAGGALIASFGLAGIIAPAMLEDLINHAVTPNGLYFAAGIRLVMGISMFFIAPRTRFPKTLRVLGVIFIMGGLSIPFVGIEFIRGIADWWLTLGPSVLSAWGVLAILFGGWLVYAVSPEKRTK
jgi:hypothetical protein